MSKTVTLSQPIKDHRGSIKSITLREPKYRDLMDLGLPSTWVVLPGGGGFEQENTTALDQWIERLCDCDPNFLNSLDLTDSLALRSAVRDFFSESAAKMALRQSADLQEGSSLIQAPAFAPSTI